MQTLLSLERALDDLGTCDALYVGDKTSDLRAAHAAGVDSMLVRRDHNRALVPEPTPTYDVDSLHGLTDQLGEY